MPSLPIFFGALTALALVAGLVALWWSVRSTLAGARDAALDLSDDLPERTALLDTKRSLLRALKDIEHERDMGKLDAADFAKLDAAYRARAKEVLALLDQDLGPYLDRARALVGDVPVSGRAYEREADEPRKKKRRASEDAETVETLEAGPLAPSEIPPADPTLALAERLRGLPEDKRKEAEAFLANLAAQAKAAPEPAAAKEAAAPEEDAEAEEKEEKDAAESARGSS